MDEIDYLVYVDVPDWGAATGPSDWRCFVSEELRGEWPTLSYEQKWRIAQCLASLARDLRTTEARLARRFP